MKSLKTILFPTEISKIAFLLWALALGSCSGNNNPNATTGSDSSSGGSTATGGQEGGGSGGAFDCTAFSESACEQESKCKVFKAYAYDSSDACRAQDYETKGCGSVGCAAAPTLATDEDNNTWLFFDGCIPPGWSEAGVPMGTESCEVGGSGGAID